MQDDMPQDTQGRLHHCISDAFSLHLYGILIKHEKSASSDFYIYECTLACELERMLQLRNTFKRQVKNKQETSSKACLQRQ